MASSVNYLCKTFVAKQVITLNNLKELVHYKKKRFFPTFHCVDDPKPIEFRLLFEFGAHDESHLSLFIGQSSPRNVYIVKCNFKVTNFKHELLKKNSFSDYHLLVAEGEGLAQAYGFPAMVPLEKIKACIDHSAPWELKIECDVTYKGKFKEYAQSVPSDDVILPESRCLSSDFLKMFESDINTDVTFRFDDKEIRAHKNILSARSTYFERLFGSRMKECSDQVISIIDCPYEEYLEMIKFLYTDLPPSKIDNIASTLLPIADKYIIPKLKYYCEASLNKNLDNLNLKEVLLLAHQYNCPGLKSACFSKIPDVKMVADWKELKDSGDLLLEYLQFLSNKQ